MDWQGLGYAAIQVAHNFGAVAVVGGPSFALWLLPAGAPGRRLIAWLVLAGWSLQITSGFAFGATSYAWYGRFPDIHGIAIAALVIKIACAIAGTALTTFHLVSTRRGDAGSRDPWRSLMALGATALTAAAFLRWLS